MNGSTSRIFSYSDRLLQQLLCIDEASFPGRIFTTGATASNILGLSLGREFAVAEAGRRRSPPSISSVAQLGVVPACLQAGVRKFQVLTTLPHSSLYKAASVVGLGKNTVVSLPLSAEEPWRFDLDELERRLSDSAGGEYRAIRRVTRGDDQDTRTGR